MTGDTHNEFSGGTNHGNVFNARNVEVHFHTPDPAQDPAGAAGFPVPRAEHYVNHVSLQRAMDEAWQRRRAAGRPTRIHLWGPPGSGRQTGLEQWLVRHREALSSGAVFLRARLGTSRSTGAERTAQDVLPELLGQLGIPRAEWPEPESYPDFFRDRTSRRPVVLLLHDALRPNQVRPLIPGSAESVMLVTGLGPLPALKARWGFDTFPVEPFRAADVGELLRLMGLLIEEPALHRSIVEASSGIPVLVGALGTLLDSMHPQERRSVLARLSDRTRGFTVKEEALDLVDESGTYEALHAVYAHLPAELARVYRLFGVLETERVSAETVRALADLPDPEAAHPLLRQLGERGLIRRDGEEYVLNPMILDHATSLVRQRGEEAEQATVRLLDHLLVTARADEAALSARWRLDPDGAYARYAAQRAAADPAERTAGAAAAARRMERQRPALFAAVATAAARGMHGHAWQLAQTLRTHCMRGGHFGGWIDALEQAVRSAEETGDLPAVARMRYECGDARVQRLSEAADDAAKAAEHLDAALELAAVPEARRTEAHRRTHSSALEAKGILARKTGRPAEALPLFEQAGAALDGVEHPRGRALLDFHRANTLIALDRQAEAQQQFRLLEAEFGRLGDGFNQGKALRQRAVSHAAAGETDAALAAYERAEPLLRTHGSAYETAGLLLARGRLRLAADRRPDAVADGYEVLRLLRDSHSGLTDEAAQLLRAAGADPEGPAGSEGSVGSAGPAAVEGPGDGGPG